MAEYAKRNRNVSGRRRLEKRAWIIREFMRTILWTHLNFKPNNPRYVDWTNLAGIRWDTNCPCAYWFAFYGEHSAASSEPVMRADTNDGRSRQHTAEIYTRVQRASSAEDVFTSDDNLHFRHCRTVVKYYAVVRWREIKECSESLKLYAHGESSYYFLFYVKSNMLYIYKKKNTYVHTQNVRIKPARVSLWTARALCTYITAYNVRVQHNSFDNRPRVLFRLDSSHFFPFSVHPHHFYFYLFRPLPSP